MNRLLRHKQWSFVKVLSLYTMILVGLFVVFLSVISPVSAEPAYTMNYQGKLTASTSLAVADGSYQMVFKLYTAPTGGAAIWTETRSGANEVTVTNGLFSVMLGDVSSLTSVNFNQPLYLGVTVEADAEMTPRKAIGTVPSAFEARQLGGVASSSFVRSDVADTISATSGSTLLTIEQNGTGNILDVANATGTVFTINDQGLTSIGTTTPFIDSGTYPTTLTLYAESYNNQLYLGSDTGATMFYHDASGALWIDNVAGMGTDVYVDSWLVGTNGMAFGGNGGAGDNLLRGWNWGQDAVLQVANSGGTYTDRMRIDSETGYVNFGGDSTPDNLFSIGNTSQFQINSSGQVVAGTWQGTAITSTYLDTSVILSSEIDTCAEIAAILGSGVTGSCGNLVLSTSPTIATPTFTTSATVPLVIGGTGASSQLTLRSTSGSGTTDDIIFQMGNNGATQWGRLDNQNDSIAFGENAGATFTSSTIYNTALGFEAGRYSSTTNADYNNTIGYQAGYYAADYGSNLIGFNAGYRNNANQVNSIGYSAGYQNTGDDAILIGYQAGYANTGYATIGIGPDAGNSNTGSYTIMLGYDAGRTNTGSYNNLIGRSAGWSNTGDNNNFIGYSAGYRNNGDYNNFIGDLAGRNLNSTSTVALGAGALYGDNSGGTESKFTAINNVAIGYQAGYNATNTANNNIFLGYRAADNLTTGNNNIIIGYDIDNVTATADNRLNIGNLIFGTGLDGTGTTLASGNVGIGSSTPSAKLSVSMTSSAATAAREYGSYLSVADTGNITTGTDRTYGQYVDVTRTSATGGFPYAYGVYSNVTGDSGGSSRAYGGSFSVTGADRNIGAEISAIDTNDQALSSIGTAGVYVYAEDQSDITTGTDTVQGINVYTYRTSASTGGTLRTYGITTYVEDNLSGGAAGSTRENYGYQVYVDGDTDGTSTNYGAYVEVAGADINYSGIFMGGNFGIGTSSPYANLSVSGNLALTGGIYDSGASLGSNGMVLLSTGSGIDWVATSSLGIVSGGTPAGSTGQLQFNNGGSFGASSLLTWNDASGYLGIGTSTPEYGLDVLVPNGEVGGIRLKGSSWDDAELFIDSSNNGGKAIITLRNYGVQTHMLYVEGESFYINPGNNINSPSDDRLTFTSGGYLGLATTTPNHRLTVEGNINLSSATGAVYFDDTKYLYASSTNDAIAFGESAGASMTSQQQKNIYLGYQAGQTADTSAANVYNIFLGAWAGKSATGGSNLFLGTSAGENNTGSYNFISGDAAGYSNTGSYNSILGYSAGASNSGDYNNFIGYSAGENNTGDFNLAFGDSAGRNNTGSYSYVIGTRAGYANSGTSTVLIGYKAGEYNSGNYTVSLGHEAGRYASTTFAYLSNYIGYQAGYANRQYHVNAIGYQAGYQNNGVYNDLMGYRAGYNNQGNYNVIIGDEAGYNNLNFGNIILGAQAGYNNDTAQNIILGGQAGYNNAGDKNYIIGEYAGYDNTGTRNIIFGYQTGYSNQGDYNNFIGYEAGAWNNTGNYNDFLGYRAGWYANSTSSISIGGRSLEGTGNYTAINNVALGYGAGRIVATGADNNILIGYQAADNLTTGNNNIIIGYDIDNITATADNRLNIGNLIFGTGLDGTGTTLASGNVGIGTTTPNYKLTVAGEVNLITSADVLLRKNNNPLLYIDTGAGNFGMTDYVFNALTTGWNNTTFGSEAMDSVTDGWENAAFGLFTLGSLTTGDYNTAFGAEALDSLVTGNNNTAFGAYAGDAVTGSNNTLFGYFAGDNITSGSNNLILGYDINAPSSTGSYQLNVGNLIFGTNVNGTGSTLSTGNIGIGTTTPVARLSSSITSTSATAGNLYGTYFALSDTGAVNSGTDNTYGQYIDFARTGATGGTIRNYGQYINAVGSQGGTSYLTGQYIVATGTDSVTGQYVESMGGNLHTYGAYFYTNTQGTGQLTGIYNEVGDDTYNAAGVGGMIGFEQNVQVDFTGEGSESYGQYQYIGTNSISTTSNYLYGNYTEIYDGSDVTSGTDYVYGDYIQIYHDGYVGGTFRTYGEYISVAGGTPGDGAATGLYVEAYGSDKNYAAIFANGDVGIGTTTPNQKLTVEGNINISSTTGAIYFNDERTIYSNAVTASLSFGPLAGVNINTSGAYSNIAIGSEALYTATSSDSNVAVGPESLQYTTSGSSNTALGHQALQYNTSGWYNIGIGAESFGGNMGDANIGIGKYSFISASGLNANNNIAIGEGTGYSINNSSKNLMIGYYAGDQITTGSGNIVIGNQSQVRSGSASNQLSIGNLIYGTNLDGTNSTISTGNIGIGTTTPNQKLTVQGNLNLSSATGAIYFDDTKYLYASSTNDSIVFGENAGATFNANTTFNVAIGYEAGRYASTTNSDNNIFIGDFAGYNNTADFSTLIGSSAGYNNSGFGSVLIGYEAGYNNQDDDNIAIGYRAGYNSQNSFNIMIGREAGYSNTTGFSNVFLGYTTGYSNTTGFNNVFLGESAGSNNSEGGRNVFAGYSSGNNNDLGFDNLFLGYTAGYANSNGSRNVYLGSGSAFRNVNGTANIAIGYGAGDGTAANTYASSTLIGYQTGLALTTGGQNLFLGYQVGDTVTTGARNILIGYDIDNTSNTASNRLNIGNLIFGTGIDGTGTTLSSGNVGIGTTTPYSKLQVVGDDGNGFTSMFQTSASSAGVALGVTGSGAGNGFIQGGLSDFSADDLLLNPFGGNVAIGKNYASSSLDIYRYTTSTSGANQGVLSAYSYIEPTGTASGSYLNYIGMETAGSQTMSAASLYAMYTDTWHGGTGTLGDARGFDINVTKGDTGAITNAFGLHVNIDNANATGAITNAYGLYVDSMQRTGSITTSWGVYVADTTAENYFGGNTGIGDLTPDVLLDVEGNMASENIAHFFNDGNNANRWGIRVQAGADDGSGTTYYLDARDGDGTQIGYIANTSGTFALTDVSDVRTKTNITNTEIVDATAVIDALRVVDFNRISDADGPRITGFIAQEVLEVYPYAVTDGPNGYLGLMKDAFVPLLVKGAQEQSARITEQGTTLATLGDTLLETISSVADLEAMVSGGLGENYRTEDTSLSVGELVALDTTESTSIIRATTGTQLFGVITDGNGITIGESGDTTKTVALTGRVTVKVNNDGGEIAIGDAIALSSEAGIGAKATTTGRVIGTALESFDDDEGEILVFVEPRTHYAYNEPATVASLFAPIDNNESDTLWNRVTTLATNFVDGILSVAGVKTEELCVGSVCVDEDQFLQMVEQAGGSSASATANNSSANEDTTPNETEPTTTESQPESEPASEEPAVTEPQPEPEEPVVILEPEVTEEPEPAPEPAG